MNFKEADEILRADPGDGYPVGLAKNKDKTFICSSSSDDGGINVSEFPNTEEFWTKVEEEAKELEKDKWTNQHSALSEAIENNSTSVVHTAFWG